MRTAEGQMVAAYASNRSSADIHARDNIFHQNVVGIGVQKITCRGDDVERFPGEIERAFQRRWCGDAGVIRIAIVLA